MAWFLWPALLLLAGCAGGTRAHEVAQTQAQVLTLQAGDQVSLDGQGVLRYVRVLNDSRCPADVQCVWAGDAEVLFEFAAGQGKPQPLVLTLTKPTSPIGGRWIHLIGLERGAMPAATVRIDDAPTAPGP